MNTHIILVGLTIIIHEALCEKYINTVSDNLRNKIALEVLKVSPVSTVVSPFALSLPLCALASVAEGHSKDELMSALGIPRVSELNKYYTDIESEVLLMQEFSLMLKNAIYFNDSLELDPRFRNSSKIFNVRIDSVGYRYPTAAAKHMNQWFARETLYRVSTLIDDDDLDNTTSMVILNGVYHKIGWDTPFDPQFTKPKKFYILNRSHWTLPMFSRIDSFDYFEDVNNNFKALRILMNTYGATMTFFLPDTIGGLPDLIKKLSNDPGLIPNTIKSLKPKMLRIQLPRMKIKTYVDWTGFLRLIGINGVFSTNSSGLEGILKNKESHVYLSKAKQKVFIEMDEGWVPGQMLMHQDPYKRERSAREFAAFGENMDQMELDHPFFFILGLENDGHSYQIATGAFYGPQEDSSS